MILSLYPNEPSFLEIVHIEQLELSFRPFGRPFLWGLELLRKGLRLNSRDGGVIIEVF